MALTRDERKALASDSVGILHWNPPPEIEELAGGRRGTGDGFTVGSYGSSGSGSAPRVRWRTIDIHDARAIAAWLDNNMTYDSHPRRRSAVAWVEGIIRNLPDALADALDAAERRRDMLRDLQANARAIAASGTLRDEFESISL